jgi:hypothetical protein
MSSIFSNIFSNVSSHVILTIDGVVVYDSHMPQAQPITEARVLQEQPRVVSLAQLKRVVNPLKGKSYYYLSDERDEDGIRLIKLSKLTNIESVQTHIQEYYTSYKFENGESSDVAYKLK